MINERLKLSIIITCYNDDKYIQKCINSVLEQITPQVEVICVDDCSTDNSKDILKNYLPFIILEKTDKNMGIAHSRNTAISMAKGEYILFLDGDDYLDPKTFEYLLPLLKNQIDIIFGLFEEFKNTPADIIRLNDPSVVDDGLFLDKSVAEILSNIQKLNLKITPAQKYIVRKQLINKHNLKFENILHEDQLWVPQLLCSAESMGFLNYKFYYHRERNESLGHRFDEKVCESYFYVCEKLLELSNSVRDGYKSDFLKDRCIYLLGKIDKKIAEWSTIRRENFILIYQKPINFLLDFFELKLSNLKI